MKLRVQRGLLVKGRADVIVVRQRAHARDLFIRRIADDVPADVGFQHDAQIQHVFERAVAQREQRADRPVDRQLRRVRDVRAAALDALHDAHGLQTLDGLTHAGAADLVSVKANIDMSKVSQTEDGSITGLDEQLAELKQSKPFLFKSEEEPKKKLDLGGPTGGAKAKSGSNLKSAVEDYYKK